MIHSYYLVSFLFMDLVLPAVYHVRFPIARLIVHLRGWWFSPPESEFGFSPMAFDGWLLFKWRCII